MERVKNILNASADLKYQVAETLSEKILEWVQGRPVEVTLL